MSRSNASISFSTIYGNRHGIRGSRSQLVVRNSIIAGNTAGGLVWRSTDQPIVEHSLFGLNDNRDVAPADLTIGAGVLLDTDPLFVDPDGIDDKLGGEGWFDDQFALSQIAGGQLVDSPALDAGSDLATNLGVDGRSTAANGIADTGVADLGVHR